MNTRLAVGIIGTILASGPALAQAPSTPVASPPAARFVDASGGLSLDEAIARALNEEPSLRAARTEIEAARSARLQAGLRPNPSISFEQRGEPNGSDTQTMVEVDWPLDLFRKRGRIAVADRQLTATEFAVADR